VPNPPVGIEALRGLLHPVANARRGDR
jgi:hypothetical protein